MINEIVNIFNANLTTDKGIIRGLAKPIIQLDDEEVIIPLIVENGEGEYPFIDDNYSFGIYHKLIGNTYTTDKNKGFGDEFKITCTSDLSIIGWGFEKDLSGENLEQWIIKNLNPNYQIVSTSFDKRAIFAGEFSKVDNFINEDIFLIKINYRVSYIVDKKCIETNSIFN